MRKLNIKGLSLTGTRTNANDIQTYIANGCPTANQNWFIGKPVDSATGLVYFGGRWYDPEIARFLGFDPAPVDEANPHSFNLHEHRHKNKSERFKKNEGHPLLHYWGRFRKRNLKHVKRLEAVAVA